MLGIIKSSRITNLTNSIATQQINQKISWEKLGVTIIGYRYNNHNLQEPTQQLQ